MGSINLALDIEPDVFLDDPGETSEGYRSRSSL